MAKNATNGRYSKEFRHEAVNMIIEGGLTAYEASRQLSLPKSTLENWVRAYKAGKLSDIGGERRPLTQVEEELERVKRELAQVKQERDILKKPPRTLPGSRCPVRGNQAVSTEVSGSSAMPGSGGFNQWLLRLAETTGFSPESRGK